MKGVFIFKGEVPGMVYLIRVNPDMDNVRLDYCAFYDPDKNNCSVYEKRPMVCQTYGDPKYNTCPYDGLTEEELSEMISNSPETAKEMHREAKSEPIAYAKEFIIPWVKAWEKAEKENPEYEEWWEGLPAANFIRN
jgi:Fe-S-cluster containining protein